LKAGNEQQFPVMMGQIEIKLAYFKRDEPFGHQ